MADYLTHYYSIDKEPFQSLSDLSDEEAIKKMEELCDDTIFGEKFKRPRQYVHKRIDTEQWVRNEFIAKGGQPKKISFPSPWCWGRHHGWSLPHQIQRNMANSFRCRS